MEAAGLEDPPKRSEKSRVLHQRAAECAARDRRDVDAAPIDSDLACVIAAWPTLPPAIQAGILAMVRAAESGDV